MKKMMERIRVAKTWREVVQIAEDKLPGTAFDETFEVVRVANKAAKLGQNGNANAIFQDLGRWFALNIEAGQVQLFHDMAAALGKWKSHKPKPNYELIALFNVCGLFQPGWTKRWITKTNPDTGRLTRGLHGVRDSIALRDIKINLARIKPDFTEDNWEASRKKIQRYAKEFKILLDDSAGRPSKVIAT